MVALLFGRAFTQGQTQTGLGLRAYYFTQAYQNNQDTKLLKMHAHPHGYLIFAFKAAISSSTK